MLSKLEFYNSTHVVAESVQEHKKLRDAIAQHYGTASVTPAQGGTLGVCFHVEVAGTRRFLKTHLPGHQMRANLAKEAEILRKIYGDAVVLESVEVPLEGAAARLCLLMTELSHLTIPMGPTQTAAMVTHYAERLQGYRPANLQQNWDLEHYIAHGREAITTLRDRHLLARQTAESLETLLTSLEDALDALPRALCHGDLGPKNIMSSGSRFIVIDWEDAFWGVAGYDYLYWLTFMDNQPHLRHAAFGRTGIDPAIERAILALIVLLKSVLSVRSGAYLRNKLPIEERIAQVLALPEAA
jgi:Ser/Thr protein kinase RdoA (MazF antagonist)